MQITCARQLCSSILFLVLLELPLLATAIPPSRPADFHHAVYSDSAAELFWQRSEGYAHGYELTRNGVLLGVFDALSYFDDSLQPGVEYIYTIQAVNFQGEYSAVSTLSLITPPGQDTIATLRRQVADLQAQLANEWPAPLPRTGQSTSLLAGDDGDWQAGVPLPAQRFTENVNELDDLNENGVCDDGEICNGSATDNLTGLVWLLDANCFGAVELPDAMNAVNTLAGDGSRCELFDFSQSGDWRLPNILEALSLVDFSQVFPSPTFSSEHPFFNLVTFEELGYPAHYWTSTGYPETNSSAYVSAGYTVSYGVGWVERWTASADGYAMAVR